MNSDPIGRAVWLRRCTATMEYYRLISIDGKPLPQHLRILDDPHEVIGGELTLDSDQIRFNVLLVPDRGRSAVTLLEAYRRLDDGDIEFPANAYEPVEFRGARKGEQFVLVATMAAAHYGQSIAETLGGNHSWIFI